MRRYELKVKGYQKLSDDQMNRFTLDNIFDVITVIRNKYGESIILKNTNNYDIFFDEISGEHDKSNKNN